MAHLAAFFGVAIVVIVTPGQDTALTIRNALAGGARSGVFTRARRRDRQAVWTLCTSLGLAALLLASEPAFVALKLAGAAYLVWLGVHSLVGAVRGARSVAVSVSARVGPATAYRRGLSATSAIRRWRSSSRASCRSSRRTRRSFLHLLALGLLFCATTLLWLRATQPPSRDSATSCAGRAVRRAARCDHRNRARRIRRSGSRPSVTRSVDRLRERAAHALELARVSVQLGAACAALGQDLPHEHEAARLEQEIVDRVVEDRCAVDPLHGGHAASASVSRCRSRRLGLGRPDAHRRREERADRWRARRASRTRRGSRASRRPRATRDRAMAGVDRRERRDARRARRRRRSDARC